MSASHAKEGAQRQSSNGESVFIERKRSYRHTPNVDLLGIPGLLIILGFDTDQVYADINRTRRRVADRWPTFFERYSEGELYDWLEQARHKWRAKMKEIHPDKSDNHYDETIVVNKAWHRLKVLFGRRGITI